VSTLKGVLGHKQLHIPYLLIVGEKEEENGTVAVRVQGEGDKGQMSLDDFIMLVRNNIESQLTEI